MVPHDEGRKAIGSFDRTVPPRETIATARRLCERYGVTRLADTTRLDRIGIPTINAIVPESPAGIGVYSGKGLTRDAATAGALMEAVERQICARFEGIATRSVPAGEVDRKIGLRALGWLGPAEPVATRLQCADAVDLITGAPVPVPRGTVQYPPTGRREFAYYSTNGLASGNTWLEAVYHGLMELIERHLWSQAHVLAHLWPRMLRVRSGLQAEGPDDPVCAEVLGGDEDTLLADPIARVRGAGLRFRLLSLARARWPVAMMATIAEPRGSPLYYHIGFGCSWSPRHAAIRAITEAAQARLTDIQGCREDILGAGAPARGALEHGRRPAALPPTGRWFYDGPAGSVRLGALPDESAPHLGTDVQRALDVIRGLGGPVACVDLAPPGCPVSVVRLVAPYLERTLVDGTISGPMGKMMDDPLAARAAPQDLGVFPDASHTGAPVR
ncbi:MAG TPA: YcaO-like family protein [Verrucomicrobiae bacterium]|nr:YcaO-like family protein [Verrucomicrobiae bacterium]